MILCSYSAPEVSQGEPYSFEADIFSVGVVLHVLLAGSLPDHMGSMSALAHNRLVSDHAKDVVHRLLDRNPATRMTIAEFFAHPWIVEGQLPDAPPLLQAQSSFQAFAPPRYQHSPEQRYGGTGISMPGIRAGEADDGWSAATSPQSKSWGSPRDAFSPPVVPLARDGDEEILSL